LPANDDTPPAGDLTVQATWLTWVRARVPGVLACAVIATAATFLSQHYVVPVMLVALLLGMAMNFLSTDGRCTAGIDFTARTVLRFGVALLGLRITVWQMAELGPWPVALVVAAVGLTILAGIGGARLLGFRPSFGFLTGGATAICGVSAALALSAALPNHPLKARATLFAIVGVSTLSTMAMIVYPIIANALGLDARHAGYFLGGSIHDVAQVVGAGYGMSNETGDVATVVKLMRVALLLPVIVLAAGVMRFGGTEFGKQRPPLLPGFAIAFAVLVVINSAGLIPKEVTSLGTDVSRWCLVAAVAALGLKTQLRELVAVGVKPVALMVGETVFMAALVLALVQRMP
jgi:uncharacterized integral membrane protein (TIGR00698 family)